jgi:simple sugar transport system permease protein
MSSSLLAVIARGIVEAAVPYACAALGGIVSERSGLANVALEASMLLGAFAASAVAVAGGDTGPALAGAFTVGALLGVKHAALCARFRASSVVVGMALNLGALGVTKGLLRVVYGSSANGPSFALRFGGLRALALTLLLASALAFVLERTRMGVRLRATGESPRLAEAAGFRPTQVRFAALAVGHGLSAVGGAALCLASGQFQAQMSAGRGFLALALVILGRWEVVPTLAGVALLALLESSEVFLQDALGLPSEVVLALPFLAILPVLALGGGRMQGARIPRFEP